jgi:hypothetical protein
MGATGLRQIFTFGQRLPTWTGRGFENRHPINKNVVGNVWPKTFR